MVSTRRNVVAPLALLTFFALAAPCPAEDRTDGAIADSIEALAHGHSREAALQALLGYGKRAEGPLVEALSHPVLDVRVWSAEALGRLHSRRAVAPLLQRLKQGPRRLRMAAASALGRIQDDRALSPLAQALRDPDKGMRAAAAAALGLLGRAGGVGPLVGALRDPSYAVRYGAVKALRWLTTKDFGDSAEKWEAWYEKHWKPRFVRKALEKALWDLKVPDAARREKALQALLDGGVHAVPLLKEALLLPGRIDRLGVLAILQKIALKLGPGKWNPAVSALLSALDQRQAKVRTAAVKIIKALGPKTAPVLVQNLRRDKPFRRQFCKSLLLGYGVEAVKPIIKALRTREPLDHEAVAQVLGQIGWKAVDLLVDAVMQEKDETNEGLVLVLQEMGVVLVELLVKTAARSGPAAEERIIWALSEIGPAAASVLVRRINATDRRTRVVALRALGRMGRQSARGPISVLLSYPSKEVRYEAALALGQLGDPRGLPALVTLSRAREPAHRLMALRGLCRVGGVEAGRAAARLLGDSDPAVRRAALAAVAALRHTEATPRVVALFRDREELQEQEVIRALASCGDRRCASLLEDVFLQGADTRGRLWAAAGLARLRRDAPAFQALSKALREGHLEQRLVAASALGETGRRDAVDLLLDAMGGAEDLDQACSEALGRLGEPALLPLAGRIAGRKAPFLACAKALNRIADRHFASVLAFRRHDDSRVRQAVVYVLGMQARPEGLPALRTALKREQSREVRLNAVLALGRVGGPEAARILLDHLKTKDNLLHHIVLRALKKVGVDAAPLVIRRLGRGCPVARAKGPDLLAWTCDRRTARYLARLLPSRTGRGSPHYEVAKAAHAVLIRLTGRSLPFDREAWVKYLRKEK